MPKEYLTVCERRVPSDHTVKSKQKIILKYRFGIPKNIEANGHAWAKITACVDYELTQARGALKKVVRRLPILPQHAHEERLAQEGCQTRGCASPINHLPALPHHVIG